MKRDDDLTHKGFIKEYNRYFTRYFLPGYISHVITVLPILPGDNVISIVAATKLSHRPTKGATQTFKIDKDKIENWRENVKLYNFVNDGKTVSTSARQ